MGAVFPACRLLQNLISYLTVVHEGKHKTVATIRQACFLLLSHRMLAQISALRKTTQTFTPPSMLHLQPL